ncbi:hypothetical protein QTG54_007627, partial [Skeletonema marinoi]
MAKYVGESAAEVAAASNTSTSTKKPTDPTQFYSSQIPCDHLFCLWG